MATSEDESDSDGGDEGVLGKLVMSAFIIAITPITEIATGAAPLGIAGAGVALAMIWGFEDEADTLSEVS